MHFVWFARPLEEGVSQISGRETQSSPSHDHLMAHWSQAISDLMVLALRSQRGTPHHGLHSRRSPNHPT